ncbi:MAG TPA: hypothetical protein VF875_12935 [Anaeromyxobacter sp.]
MTLHRIAAAALALAAASPAAAQLSNRSIALESGISTPFRAGEGVMGGLALVATTWLDGDLEGVARVAFGAGARTDGRASAGDAWTGTAGVRLSLAPEPLRPQVSLELGWRRWAGPDGVTGALALGAGLGLEWFVARDLSLALRCAVRGAGGTPELEVSLGAAAYF